MKEWVKRLGILLLACFLIAYVGYQIFQVLYSNVSVETVSAYSVYDTVETQAIAIRNETLIHAQTGNDYLFYTLNNGNRVAKGGTIAELFADETAASLQQQLELLDEEIALLQGVESLASNNYASLDAIDLQMAAVVQEIRLASSGQEEGNLRDLHAELLTLMNKRQVVVGAVDGFADKLAQLHAERQELAKKVTAATGVVRSPVSGYFIDHVDGYETYFSADEDDVAALTTANVEEALNTDPTPADSCVGKVSSNYSWYLACVVDGEKAARLEVGDALKIRLPFVTGETLETEVLAVNQNGEGQSAVILKCNLMSEELADIRIQSVQLLLEEHSGLRLPDEALHFDAENRAGAYVRMGTTVTFRYVDVLYHNEKDGYSICAVPEAGDRTYVQLFDDVVVEGKDLYDGKVVQS